MVTATTTLPLLREHFRAAPELFAVIVNARSQFEANLAIDILRETTPERVLVAAVNLREALLELPSYPCTMAIDDATLARIAHLKKDRAVLRKRVKGVRGAHLAVTTAGNFCFDLIVEVDDHDMLWTPSQSKLDIINPEVVPYLIEREGLLQAVIELVVFNPDFYLSLEDWNLEHAVQTLADVRSLF